MGPPCGRISSSTSVKQPSGWPNCPSGCSIRLKPAPCPPPHPPPPPPSDCCYDNGSSKCSKFDPCLRPDVCDSMYKASSMALLRSRGTAADACCSAAAAADKSADEQYLEACRKIVEFMCALWREQKMCDVKIKAKDDCIQAHKLALGAHSDFLVTKFSEYPCGEVVIVDMSEFDISTIMDLLRYVYTTELSISPSSIGPLLRASDELGITAVYDVCVDYLNDIKVDNAIYLYSIAESYGLTDIRDKSVCFIADNFVSVTSTEHFVLVPFACIMELLSDDRLCIASELDVFAAVVRWIDCDRVQRLSFAPELIGRAVRLQFVSPEYLVKNVETVDWLFDNPLCQAILFDVYKYHALNLSGSRLALAFPQQKERGPR